MDIKIIPSRLSGTVIAPSSKSHAHRAMICAALCKEQTKINMHTVCEDTEATARCISALGANVEYKNGTLTVTPNTFAEKGIFDCGESGSTFRFMLPVAAACGCNAEFIGRGRLAKRPIDELLSCLSAHGTGSTGNILPFEISGKMSGGDFTVGGDRSSQFLTGLLLALPVCGGGRVTLTSPLQSKPYVELTQKIMADFGILSECDENIYTVGKREYVSPKNYSIEGDWSNGAFWLASGLEVRGLNEISAQGDREFARIMIKMGATLIGDMQFDISDLHGTQIDVTHIPDLVMPIAAVAAISDGQTVITGGERLKLKESDRLQSVYSMLSNLGADVSLRPDGFMINGKKELSGGTVDSENDHRIAMATAILAPYCTSPVILKGADAVNKSYPTFWAEYERLGGRYELL